MDITTTDSAREALHVDPQEAHDREIEIARTAEALARHIGTDADRATHEAGARSGLMAYRECYELAVLIAAIPPDGRDPRIIADLVTFAQAALEAARG